MVRWSYIAALVGSLALIGCGGGAKPAQAPESNPWADYKGTYAPGGPGEEASSPSAKSTADAKAAPADAKSAPDPKTASAPEPKPKKGAKPKKVAEAKPEAEPKSDLKPDDAKTMYGVTSGADPEPTKKVTKKRAGPKRATKKPATAKR